MKERCWSCQKWEEHFYWDHLEETNFHFMKVMDECFSEGMEFPPKFSKNFRVDLLDVVALKVHTGQSWDIALSKELGHLYFNGGWKQFIEENKIVQGDTLVFEYTGDSSFTVQIFDQTGCVRVASDVAVNARAKEGILNQTSRSSKVKNENPTLHELSDDRCTSSGRICKDVEHFISKPRKDRSVGPSKICRVEQDDIDLDSILEKNTHHLNFQDAVKILQLNFAGNLDSGSFVKFIKPSNLTKLPYMAIPAKFLSNHVPKKPNGISICMRRKVWFLRCKYTTSSWGFYGKSLFDFIQENDFKQGDACIFKLRDNRKMMIMDIIHVREAKVDSILKNSV